MDEYVLYGRVDTKEIVLESWGASTKHPDMIEHFTEWSDYENAKQYLVCPQEDNGFIFQWLLNHVVYFRFIHSVLWNTPASIMSIFNGQKMGIQRQSRLSYNKIHFIAL